MRFVKPTFFQSERHTGARMFVWSGAIYKNVIVPTNIGDMLLDSICRYADRSGTLGFSLRPRFCIPGIDYRDTFVIGQLLPGLINRNFSHIVHPFYDHFLEKDDYNMSACKPTVGNIEIVGLSVCRTHVIDSAHDSFLTRAVGRTKVIFFCLNPMSDHPAAAMSTNRRQFMYRTLETVERVRSPGGYDLE
jgi:hypothetical protein